MNLTKDGKAVGVEWKHMARWQYAASVVLFIAVAAWNVWTALGASTALGAFMALIGAAVCSALAVVAIWSRHRTT